MKDVSVLNVTELAQVTGGGIGKCIAGTVGGGVMGALTGGGLGSKTKNLYVIGGLGILGGVEGAIYGASESCF